MSRTKQVFARLGLLAGAVLVVVLVAELGLRLAGVSYPRTTEADPVLGILHRPGVQYRFRDEGDAWIEFNSAGFRDEEWPVDKPADEYRIAVLGDSYIEGLQVAAEDRITNVLARNLAAQPEFAGRTVRVMNFGMSGYGTGQELLLLRDRVARYRPDMVVLALLTGNDFSDNSSALRPHHQRPFFKIVDDQLVLDDSYLKWVNSESRPAAQAMYALADWSRIVQLVYRARKNLRARGEMARARARGATEKQELGLDAQVYVPPTTDAWREAWAITERLLLEFAKEARAMGAQPLVVTLSNGEQVHPDDAVRQEFATQVGAEDLTYPDKRLAQFLTEHDIPVLTLAPELLEYARSEREYLHGFANTALGRGHWNEEGHAEAAKLLAVKILAMNEGGHSDTPAAAEPPETAHEPAETFRKAALDAPLADSSGREPAERSP